MADKDDKTQAQDRQDQKKNSKWRELIAETLGTSIFVFISGGAYTTGRILSHSIAQANSASWVLGALGHGLAYLSATILVIALSRGHINPAITIGLAITNHFPRRKVIPQISAQFLGGIIGAGVIFIAYGQAGVHVGLLGADVLSKGTSLLQGLCIEAISTGILAMVLMATRTNQDISAGMSALAVGVTLTILVAAVGPVTGAAVNPARAFGPNLIDAFFGVHVDWTTFIVVYLIGPLLGATVALALYNVMAQLKPGDMY